jgi:hypothetical protein
MVVEDMVVETLLVDMFSARPELFLQTRPLQCAVDKGAALAREMRLLNIASTISSSGLSNL